VFRASDFQVRSAFFSQPERERERERESRERERAERERELFKEFKEF
jgi:hypothetical protein